MGTINYFTSDIITLGVNVDDYIPDDNYDFVEEDRAVIEDIIRSYGLAKSRYNDGFAVVVEPGYYDGFSLRIFEGDEEEADIEALEKCLLECADYLSVCYPGWGTRYVDDYEEKERLIKEAIAEYRKVRETGQ